MKAKLRISFVGVLLVFLCFHFTWAFEKTSIKDYPDIDRMVNEFITIVKTKNSKEFIKRIHSSGLVVVRSFCSGFGTRGSEVRQYLSVKEITRDLQFAVKGETPVTLDFLFPQLLDQGVKDIPVTHRQNMSFQFPKPKPNHPLNEDVWDISGAIFEKIISQTESNPRVFILANHQLALTEAQVTGDIVTGGWAIFNQSGGKYYLKAIIDLR